MNIFLKKGTHTGRKCDSQFPPSLASLLDSAKCLKFSLRFIRSSFKADFHSVESGA